MRVDTTPLVQKLLHSLITRQDNETLGTEHEAVNRAVFSGPFLELEVCIPSWHLCGIVRPLVMAD